MAEQDDFVIWCERDELPQISGETREIDAATIASKNQLMASVAAALEFPEYFSGNWDSFDECLAHLDLSSPTSSLTLVIRNPEHLFQLESATTFFSILRGALLEWSERDEAQAFTLLLEGKPSASARTILEAAGFGSV